LGGDEIGERFWEGFDSLKTFVSCDSRGIVLEYPHFIYKNISYKV